MCALFGYYEEKLSLYQSECEANEDFAAGWKSKYWNESFNCSPSNVVMYGLLESRVLSAFRC